MRNILSVVIAFAIAGSVLSASLFSIPACCLHKDFCPMHPMVAKPACNMAGMMHAAKDDRSATSMKSCESFKWSAILLQPGLLPASIDVSHSLPIASLNSFGQLTAWHQTGFGLDHPPRFSSHV